MQSHNPLILVYIIPFAAVIQAITYYRARNRLEEWTAQNPYRIIRSTYIFLPMPWQPFYWKSRAASIFSVTVADSNGVTRTGHILFLDAAWSTEARTEVCWDG